MVKLLLEDKRVDYAAFPNPNLIVAWIQTKNKIFPEVIGSLSMMKSEKYLCANNPHSYLTLIDSINWTYEDLLQKKCVLGLGVVTWSEVALMMTTRTTPENIKRPYL